MEEERGGGEGEERMNSGALCASGRQQLHKSDFEVG